MHERQPFSLVRGGAAAVATLVAAALITACGSSTDTVPASAGASGFQEHLLVADTSGIAPTTDPELVNAWGLARSPTGPWWVADNHAGVSTVYDSSGAPFPAGNALVVTVPPPNGSPAGTGAAPTGMVFNSTPDFVVSAGGMSGASLFIFATEDGTISGWSQGVDTMNAILAVDNSSMDAIYKGLALATAASGNFLYATDFHNGRVDVFDATFMPVPLSGAFHDASIPAGFAPFGIQEIGGNLYVTYAKQDENAEDDMSGPGNGYVDVFTPTGQLVRRFASQGTLNSPWGVALAPANFGSFSNALLVGNFGDGRINAFNAGSGAFLGQIGDAMGTVLVNPGLWAISFGNGATAGPTNTLFFSAGPGGEDHGIFGSIQANS